MAEVLLIEPVRFRDDRGYFVESYKKSDFRTIGITEQFVQENHSCSRRNVVRGLHYQMEPAAQAKLVRVISGSVWDVAVDVRSSSTTFGKWIAQELSGDNGLMLYIPGGFAHGFVALTDGVHLVYKCTAEYDPAAECGIRWDDPQLRIPWPVEKPILSKRDAALPLLRDARVFP
jgi:dTDP-4-dehydrorhamnose 3,5-epimerase